MRINSDKVLRKIAGIVRRVTQAQKYKSIEFLCQFIGDDAYLNEKAVLVKKKIVTHICTTQSTFVPKNNACLVYINPIYGDTNIYKYAEKAIREGALVLITKNSIPDYPCIVSKDPIKTYAKLCRYYRDLQTKVRITAVTGSIGKTTTKNMIGSVYSVGFKTLYTEENNNTKTTVGFAVQHIPGWAEMMVQEVHEGEPNETQWISNMLHPEVVVLTSIDNSHYKYFGSADKIVEECCSVTKYMSDDGKVIVNQDEFTRFDLLNGRKIITVSTTKSNADFWASSIEVDNNGLSFVVNIKESGKSTKVRLNNIYAKHNVVCALYAFASGYCQGIPADAIVWGLENYQTTGVRQNVIKADHGVLLYVDCYNAVAKSMKSAIEACDMIPVIGKRIAVLGDIEEVGDLSDSMHKEVVDYVNGSMFDVLFTFGEKMKKAAEVMSIRDSLKLTCFNSRKDLSDQLKKEVAGDDLVLFKASNACNLGECLLAVWPELAPVILNKRKTRVTKYTRLLY